ncbi:hypothetical protein [Streptomyces sp. NPDC057403]|uniref:hypothetical protein n=1 Tax=Streptomyces sp. NPDC057403 TaxID=3346119 RepID=UPI00368916B6
MSAPARALYVVTVEPVQEVAAEPDTLAAITEALRRRAQPVDDMATLTPLMGVPIVTDPALPPGFVYLRPTPAPKEQP